MHVLQLACGADVSTFRLVLWENRVDFTCHFCGRKQYALYTAACPHARRFLKFLNQLFCVQVHVTLTFKVQTVISPTDFRAPAPFSGST